MAVARTVAPAVADALALLLTPPRYVDPAARVRGEMRRGDAALTVADAIEAAVGVPVLLLPHGGVDDAEVWVFLPAAEPADDPDDPDDRDDPGDPPDPCDAVLAVHGWLREALADGWPFACVRATRYADTRTVGARWRLVVRNGR